MITANDAQSFPCRAAEQLSKLAEHKDNNVFKDLASLSAPLVDRTGAANLSKSICQVWADRMDM